MKRPYKTFIVMAVISVLFLQVPCEAQTMFRKLGRGVANTLTFPFEVPKSIHEVLYDNGPAAGVTYGLLDGVFKGVIRALTGVYEIITFPIPFPKDYKNIVEPEFLFEPDKPYSF